MPTPTETIEHAAKRARDAADDFKLLHGVKPNALMAGQRYVAAIVQATQTLGMLGQTKTINQLLLECPKLKQRMIGGMPIIISNRDDDHLAAVLVGDLAMLEARPQPQPAKR